MSVDPSKVALVSAIWIELHPGDCIDHRIVAYNSTSLNYLLTARDSLVRVEQHDCRQSQFLDLHLADYPRMGDHPHENQHLNHVERDMTCPSGNATFQGSYSNHNLSHLDNTLW